MPDLPGEFWATLARMIYGTDAALIAAMPDSHFICEECGSGPWHKAWGRYCPNCTGAT